LRAKASYLPIITLSRRLDWLGAARDSLASTPTAALLATKKSLKKTAQIQTY